MLSMPRVHLVMVTYDHRPEVYAYGVADDATMLLLGITCELHFGVCKIGMNFFYFNFMNIGKQLARKYGYFCVNTDSFIHSCL